ncbi:MAG: chromate transporter [Bacilli bacterium]|nr:chromate transporter [Bacilli bacterium]
MEKSQSKRKLNKYLDLTWTFFKVGLFTFGGGLAMLPLITKETVEKHGWVDEDQMGDILAISEATPGPISVNAATFIGYKVGKLFGAMCATLGLVLPSLIIIILISLVIDWFLGLEYVAYAFMGIRCAVAILIFNAAIKIYKKIEKRYLTYILLLIGLAITILIPSISSIYVLLFGGVVAGVEFLIATKIAKKKKAKEEKENKEDEVC